MSRQIAILGGLVFLFAINADAQRSLTDSSTTARNWLVGASVGLPGYEREPAPELFTIGMNFTQMRPGRFGADFAIGTMPRAFAFGAGVLGARAGVVLPIAPTPDVLFLPSAGVSLVGGAGEGGGAAIGGLNAGAAMVFWTNDVGFRSGITWHRFQDFRESVWLVEIGIVHAR